MSKKQEQTAIVWFTNNLRTHDNESLSRATSEHGRVVGVYCFDPRHYAMSRFGFRKTASFRAQFLIESIHDLRFQLSELNIPLVVGIAKPNELISKLTQELDIVAIYHQEEWTYEENEEINELRTTMDSKISLIGSYDQTLYHPKDLPFTVDEMSDVFTPFRKRCEKYATIQREQRPSKLAHKVSCKIGDIPTLPDLGLESFEQDPRTAFPFRGGETNALARLKDYLFDTHKAAVYKKTRNGLVGKDYSTKFSPWLANGSLSARTVLRAVEEFETKIEKNQSTYWIKFELLWREFFKFLAMKHGNAFFKVGGIREREYDWSNDRSKVDSWISGATGSAFVDANMNEIKKTGWMSNRGRQNVASYFSRHLGLDWRIGASYFESVLLDYDVHSNYGNWMYVSGVGSDPRDRKFNVDLQAERYDPKGKFQRLWLQPNLFTE